MSPMERNSHTRPEGRSRASFLVLGMIFAWVAADCIAGPASVTINNAFHTGSLFNSTVAGVFLLVSPFAYAGLFLALVVCRRHRLVRSLPILAPVGLILLTLAVIDARVAWWVATLFDNHPPP